MNLIDTHRELTPLYFPTTEPRSELLEDFAKRIQDVCNGNPKNSMIFLLFQREMMLRRRPDPALIAWANKLKVEGTLQGNDMVYMRYLLRKWLACLPPLFVQLSCLQKIVISEETEYDALTEHHMYMHPDSLRTPDKLFQNIMNAFVGTIPFFAQNNDHLRQSTLLVEGSVFSLEEWWQAFLAKFQNPYEDIMTPYASALTSISRRMSMYVEQPSSIHEASQQPEEAMVDILAHSAIHSYIG